jgi:hypothetical protein
MVSANRFAIASSTRAAPTAGQKADIRAPMIADGPVFQGAGRTQGPKADRPEVISHAVKRAPLMPLLSSMTVRQQGRPVPLPATPGGLRTKDGGYGGFAPVPLTPTADLAPESVSQGPPHITHDLPGRTTMPDMSGHGWTTMPGDEIPTTTAPARNGPSAQPKNTVTVGQLHIDGTNLGRWMVNYLDHALSKPQQGMTGVDPRANPPRTRMTPF